MRHAVVLHRRQGHTVLSLSSVVLGGLVCVVLAEPVCVCATVDLGMHVTILYRCLCDPTVGHSCMGTCSFEVALLCLVLRA